MQQFWDSRNQQKRQRKIDYNIPLLRIQDWKTVKTESKKINELLTYHNKQHHGIKRAEAKSVGDKNGVPIKNKDQKFKTWIGN